LYDTLGANAVEYIVNHAEIRTCVCAGKQLDVVREKEKERAIERNKEKDRGRMRKRKKKSSSFLYFFPLSLFRC